MKNPKQSDQQKKYYAPFHTFMCNINKQYNFGGTSPWQVAEHADIIYKGFCWVLGIFPQCIADINWKILKLLRRLIADVVSTSVLKAELWRVA